MSSPTEQRDLVYRIVAADPEQALEVARGIDHPWFRSQALSAAALRQSDFGVRERVISEAFAAAGELEEPNRIVTVSSWPVKALAFSGNTVRMVLEAERLLSVIGNERSPVRRADALRDVLGATIATREPI